MNVLGSLRKLLVGASIPLVALVLGGVLAPRAEDRRDDTLRDLKIFAETLRLVSQQYVEEVDFRRLERGAYQGLAESLDPWSSYHDPVRMKPLLARDRSGDLGMVLVKYPQQYVAVACLLPGSPADEAGIERGQGLETIDGIETKDLPLKEAEAMLAGPPGTTVRIGLFREPDEEVGRVVEITRKDLSALRVVVSGAGTSTAVLRVTDTRPGIVKLVSDELARLRAAGTKDLVLDLRANPGGSPGEAAGLASLFAGPGALAVRTTRTGSGVLEGREAQAWTGGLVVLTGRGTIGEAELVADALRTRRAARLVGSPTFGKSTQQDLVLLPDGSGLWMTVARYGRADGSVLPEKGLEPDVKVATAREEELESEGAASGEAGETAPEAGKPAPRKDPVLARALELLAGSPAEAK